jgi:hypothetical protein
MLRLGNNRGQTVILFTMGLTTMLGMAGLAVDIGWSYFREQAAKTAAEAAALGAAKAALVAVPSGNITCSTDVVCQSATVCPDPIPSPPTSNFHNGCHYANDNGFSTSSGVKVMIAANTTTPPVSGVAGSYWVTATVTSTQAQGFSAALGKFMGVVSASATVVIQSAAVAGCIYVLNPSAAGALQIAGTNIVTATCGVNVNSSSPQALQVKGNACLSAGTAAIKVVGGYSGSNGCISPSPTGGTTFSDPLASVTAPSWTACDHATTVSLSGGISVLSPGVYCGGISISGLSDVTFLPGTYVLNGGGLNITSANVVVSGAGVTFYNTSDATHTYAPISVTGNGQVTLTAPTSGSLANVLFFQDRSITSSSTNVISGGSTNVFSGVMYFKNSPVSFAGNSVSSSVSIVADTVSFTGTSVVTGNAVGGSSSGGTLGLVE